MTDEFRAMIERRRAHMAFLRETFDRQGYLLGASTRTPDYSILLTKNTSDDARWRVTSFSGRTPLGHREYDALDGAAPTRNALAEFASNDLIIMPRCRRRPQSINL